MTKNEYAEARRAYLHGECEIRITSAVKELACRTHRRINILMYIRNWVKETEVRQLYPQDPVNVVYFRAGSMRLALLAYQGALRVGLSNEFDDMTDVDVLDWLSRTDRGLPPRTGCGPKI
jgi:hypothetical protein